MTRNDTKREQRSLMTWSVLPVIVTALLLSAISVPSTFAAENEAPHASKFHNVTWYYVANVAYKPGKMSDALKLVKKYFIPATKKSGTPGPVMVLENRSGPWDVTVIWKMKDGPSTLEWKMSPDGVAWNNAFNELAGGTAQAKKIRNEYNSYVSRESGTLTMEEMDMVSQAH